MELVEDGDIPTIVKHFAALRTEYGALKDKIEKLESEVNDLSYNLIPTMFEVSRSKQSRSMTLEESPSTSVGSPR